MYLKSYRSPVIALSRACEPDVCCVVSIQFRHPRLTQPPFSPV